MATVTEIRQSKHETAPLAESRERLREDANPREVAQHAKSMDPLMLRCRRMRQHKWEPRMASKVRGGFTEELICERCGSTKERFYASNGHIAEYGQINYAEGYLLTGLGRLGDAGRDVINLASLQADLQMRTNVRVSAKKRSRSA